MDTRSKFSSSRLSAVVAGGAILALAVSCTSPAPPAPKFQYGANGFGSYVSALGIVKSDRTFLSTLNCTTTPGLNVTNHGAGSNVPGIATVGAISSRAYTTGGSTVASNGVEDIANVSLLNGLITADAIHITSTTRHSALGFSTAGATQFVGLRIGGFLVPNPNVPNKVISLPGIGSLTLNQHNSAIGATSASQRQGAIHLVTLSKLPTLPGLPGLPIPGLAGLTGIPGLSTLPLLGQLSLGANVVIGETNSSLGGPVVGTLAGQSYGTNLTVAGVLSSGPSGRVIMPCQGTGGKLVSNVTAGVTVPGIATIGAITNTARGTMTKTSETGETTSTIAGANLLNGLITVGAIRADAHAAGNGKTFVLSDTGSSMVGLSVRGLPALNANVPANTHVTIPGVGTLWLNRVVKSGREVSVTMIELDLAVAQGKLPAGAVLKVGVAQASAH